MCRYINVYREWEFSFSEAKARENNWLPFLNTDRTMCLFPEPPFRRVLEETKAWA